MKPEFHIPTDAQARLQMLFPEASESDEPSSDDTIPLKIFDPETEDASDQTLLKTA